MFAGCQSPDALGPTELTPLFASSGNSGNQTAQSIMIQLDGPTDFVINGEENWQFSRHDLAKAAYNTTVSGPDVSCNPSNKCPSTLPSAPAYPDPDPSKINTGVVSQQACTFWNGGTPTGGSYKQSTSQTYGSGGSAYTVKWEWTYTYAVVGAIAAHTGWELNSSTNPGTFDATYTGYVAGQSATWKSSGPFNLKYSHTLLNGDGTTRVSGFGYTLDGAPAVALTTTTELGVNYNYLSNAGENGNTQWLASAGGLVSAIQQGLIPSRQGLADNFSGNNYTNGDRAVFGPFTISLTEGTHSFTIGGTVKDNTGLISNLNFSVTKNFVVHAQGCAN